MAVDSQKKTLSAETGKLPVNIFLMNDKKTRFVLTSELICE